MSEKTLIPEDDIRVMHAEFAIRDFKNHMTPREIVHKVAEHLGFKLVDPDEWQRLKERARDESVTDA